MFNFANPTPAPAAGGFSGFGAPATAPAAGGFGGFSAPATAPAANLFGAPGAASAVNFNAAPPFGTPAPAPAPIGGTFSGAGALAGAGGFSAFGTGPSAATPFGVGPAHAHGAAGAAHFQLTVEALAEIENAMKAFGSPDAFAAHGGAGAQPQQIRQIMDARFKVIYSTAELETCHNHLYPCSSVPLSISFTVKKSSYRTWLSHIHSGAWP
jgi:hypothetical protein